MTNKRFFKIFLKNFLQKLFDKTLYQCYTINVSVLFILRNVAVYNIPELFNFQGSFAEPGSALICMKNLAELSSAF